MGKAARFAVAQRQLWGAPPRDRGYPRAPSRVGKTDALAPVGTTGHAVEAIFLAPRKPW
jgi:hypothetical protein